MESMLRSSNPLVIEESDGDLHENIYLKRG
jgi:hypothetical protein